jgi:microcystin degradation protein MlrC
VNDQTPMPTVLGDPLPGFIPELWLQAQAETQWAANQVQGFTYADGPTGDAVLVVRDLLKPAGEQTVWSERLSAADLSNNRAMAEAAYQEAHGRMMHFLATQGVVLCAARYRTLRSGFVAKGVV